MSGFRTWREWRWPEESASPPPLASTPQPSSPSFVAVPPQFLLPVAPHLQQLAQKAVREQAEEAFQRLHIDPTPAQWDMILSPRVTTCVIAGAGSGKTTTLILRLLVLHKVVGLELHYMHVFSFTKASSEEFKRKLLDKLVAWETEVEEQPPSKERRQKLKELVDQTVSTFHRTLYSFRQEVLPGRNPRSTLFEFLNEERRPAKAKAPAKAVQQVGKHPLLTTNLTAAQVIVLRAAHNAAFAANPYYQQLVNDLMLLEDRRAWAGGSVNRKLAAERHPQRWADLVDQEWSYHGFDSAGFHPRHPVYDEDGVAYGDEYRLVVAKFLRRLGKLPRHLSTFPVRSPIHRFPDGTFYAAFQVEDLYLHVERFEQGNQAAAVHERQRRILVAKYSYQPDQHRFLLAEHFHHQDGKLVLKPDAQYRLEHWLHVPRPPSAVTAAPEVRIHLPGDIRPTDLHELLYQEGLFIENLGLEVGPVDWGSIPPDPMSAAVAELLPMFWQAFQREMARPERELLRFHEIVTPLRKAERLRALCQAGRLEHLRHLFIDEFQDVSPELIEWTKGLLRVQVEAGKEVSLTAIGDDFQGIYGWRGAHPGYLFYFPEQFPAMEEPKQIFLQENFRCRQPIIAAGEAALRAVSRKFPKHGISKSPVSEVGIPSPVRLIPTPLSWWSGDPDADLWALFCEHVEDILLALPPRHRPNPLSVFILARTNKQLEMPPKDDLERRLLNWLRDVGVEEISLSTGTFHWAKGLEADIVLLLGDSVPPDQQPLREAFFRHSPLSSYGTYLQNQTDETYRLAYVALTRARLGCVWVPLPGKMEDDDLGLIFDDEEKREPTPSERGSFRLVHQALYSRPGR